MNGVSHVKKHWYWFLVPLVVVLELFMQWWIPRQDPGDADWQSALRAVEELRKPGDLVVIAPAWAVQGRMIFKEYMGFKDFGRFDTTPYKRLLEVSIGGAKSPESTTLTPDRSLTFGKLTVNRYALPKPPKILFDFVDKWKSASFDGTKKTGPKLVIDHWFNPRRVIQLDLKRTATVSYDDVPLDGVLRGYAIIGYREGRFDKGEPIRLEIFLNDKKLGEHRVANFSPIEPFEYRLPGSGKGTIRFRASVRDNKQREFGIAADVRKGTQ